jgi:hypothetical protein
MQHKAVGARLRGQFGARWRQSLPPPRGPDICMRLALYAPGIPQNTGAIVRLAACLAVPVGIIGPSDHVAAATVGELVRFAGTPAE